MILAAGAGASAGPLGLLIVVLMGVVTVLLIRNMNGRLKRLPPSFDKPEEPLEPDAGPDTDTDTDTDTNTDTKGTS